MEYEDLYKLSKWEQDCADLNTDFYGEDTDYLQALNGQTKNIKGDYFATN